MSSSSAPPPPPYYAVIFTSQRTAADADGYSRAAARMEELARQQPGFLALESVRGSDRVGITISYWRSKEAIAAWKRHAEHLLAQAAGRERWYDWYHVRIARVEAQYAFGGTPGDLPNPG